MPEIEGILEEIEIINGIFAIGDLKIVVGGIEFYKTVWEPSLKTLNRYKRKTELKNILDLFKQDESFPKDEFLEELTEYLHKKIKVEYETITKGLGYHILDRLHRINIPRIHMEIKEIEYLE